MKDIGIKFFNEAGELKEYDYLGRLIPKDKSERYGLCIPISFVLNKHELNTVVDIWIKKKDCPPNKQIKEFTFIHATIALSKRLSKQKHFNAFSRCNKFSDLPIDENTNRINFDKHALKIIKNVSIQDELYECLVKQQKKDMAERKRFNLAKEKLCEFANFTPSYMRENKSVIRNLLRDIQSIYRESENRFLEGWLREKLPRLESSFEEILRRRQENNYNFRCYLDDIRTIPYDLREPFCWYREPITEISFER